MLLSAAAAAAGIGLEVYPSIAVSWYTYTMVRSAQCDTMVHVGSCTLYHGTLAWPFEFGEYHLLSSDLSDSWAHRAPSCVQLPRLFFSTVLVVCSDIFTLLFVPLTVLLCFSLFSRFDNHNLARCRAPNLPN